MPRSTLVSHDFLNRYGPWAVVTGASSGLGRAIAQELAAAGANLGRIGRFLNWSLALLPRALRTRILGGVMAGMTRNAAPAGARSD